MIINVYDMEGVDQTMVYMDGDDFELGIAIARILDCYRTRLIEGGNTKAEADKIMVGIGKIAYSPLVKDKGLSPKDAMGPIFEEAESWRYK